MRENSSFETSAAMFAGTDRNINKVTITVRIIVNVVSLLKVFDKNTTKVMLLYLLSKKIFQKIRPSPADGKADGGTWFWNFYLTDILWGEHTQLTFIRRMLSDAALGMQDIDSLQQVAYETGITPCLRVTLLIGLRQHVAILRRDPRVLTLFQANYYSSYKHL